MGNIPSFTKRGRMTFPQERSRELLGRLGWAPKPLRSLSSWGFAVRKPVAQTVAGSG